MSRDMTKPTKWLCAQRRLRSAWASAQSEQSSLSAWRKLRSLPINRTAKTLIRLGECPGWSESSLGAHSLCSFCHVTAHILNNNPRSAQWFQRTANIICTSKTFQNSLVTRVTWLCKHDWESWQNCRPGTHSGKNGLSGSILRDSTRDTKHRYNCCS